MIIPSEIFNVKPIDTKNLRQFQDLKCHLVNVYYCLRQAKVDWLFRCRKFIITQKQDFFAKLCFAVKTLKNNLGLELTDTYDVSTSKKNPHHKLRFVSRWRFQRVFANIFPPTTTLVDLQSQLIPGVVRFLQRCSLNAHSRLLLLLHRHVLILIYIITALWYLPKWTTNGKNPIFLIGILSTWLSIIHNDSTKIN